MKKFLAIAVSAIFLLGFAASAFAIHAEIPSETQAAVAAGETQITLGGDIRVRGEIRQNTTDFNDNLNDSSSFYDQRVRLSLNAKVSDNVTGFVMLESNSGADALNSDVYMWGPAATGATGIYGAAANAGNIKATNLGVLEAWILYTNDLVNVKIGHMPLALGNNIFFDHRKYGDDAIVLFKQIDNLHLAALTAKFSEGQGLTSGTASFDADDADAYVVLAAYKGEGFNISGDVTWVNDNGFLEGFTGVVGPQADLYNFGIRGDVNVTDNIKLMADFELQTGSIDNMAALAAPGLLGCTTTNDCDFSGYAFMVGAEANIDPIKLGLTVGYGSGDDNAADQDVDVFVTSLSTGIPYIGFVYGTRATHVTGFGNAGYANTTFVKASVSGSPMEKMTLGGDVIWLQASEDVANGAGVLTDDIGWEIDGKMDYDLAKNLKYWVEGGYMFAGDVYDTSATVGADDAYAVRHGIELSF